MAEIELSARHLSPERCIYVEIYGQKSLVNLYSNVFNTRGSTYSQPNHA
jgi:hypothetical protein